MIPDPVRNSDAVQEITAQQMLIADRLNSLTDMPPRTFRGRGIVICGGGIRYFTCAWVCINMLKKLGCGLPIQLWHLGKKEMTTEMKSLATDLGIDVVDAEEMRRRTPSRRLGGWELKAYAIMNSPYEEVLLLDADNVCVKDPSFLFDDPRYRETGAVFWPDFGRLKKDCEIWSICQIPFRDEPEFETGQILINKSTCWKALGLTMHLNEYSDFFYRYIYGDKETFHMAWRMLDQSYSMPERAIYPLPFTMCQHDFEGHRLFQHRNMAKWSLFLENPDVGGFQFQEECKQFLAELQSHWDPEVAVPRFRMKKGTDTATARDLIEESWIYRRVGHDQRLMTFRPDGLVGTGAEANEVFWNVTYKDGITRLSLASESKVICYLNLDADGAWRGAWLFFEKMPIELCPVRPHGAGESKSERTLSLKE